MKVQIRKDRQGREYYTFTYWDSAEKKNKRLKKAQVPSYVNSLATAEEFAKAWSAQVHSARFRAQQRLEWQNHYYDFKRLLDSFTTRMKKKAPADWHNSVRDLQYYVLDFFLRKKGANKPGEWHQHYFAFKEWLEDEAVTIKGNRKISYSQKNSAISSLNTFIDFLIERKDVEFSTPKCRRFEDVNIKRRDYTDVLSDDELKIIVSTLRELDNDVADFVFLSAHIGSRLSETLGLSLASVQQGVPSNQVIQNILKQHNLECFGYVSFNTQVVNANQLRDAQGKVVRKQLKHRPNIQNSEFRVVPILDGIAFNLLADRYQNALSEFNGGKGKYGNVISDYLLFDGLSENRISRALKKAYAQHPKFKAKTVHCLRHTFATNLAGRVAHDHRLFQILLGHRNQKTTASYNHIYGQISESVATQQTLAAGGLKKVPLKKSSD